jgi:general secretion pathway protein D
MEGKRIRAVVLVALSFTCAFPSRTAAESASAAFKAGEHAEKKNDLDTAYQAYKRAHEAKPNDPRITAAFLRMRFYASTEHVHSGEGAYDRGDLETALTEFRLAYQIDPSNFEAIGLVRRTMEELRVRTRDKSAPAAFKEETSLLSRYAHSAAGPIELHFKADLPVSIHMTTTSDVLYKIVGQLGGLNVLIDPEYKPQKLSFELKDVTIREALNMLAVQSKTFWRPLSSNTILVTSDSGSKRKELEQSVMKTFYLRNAATPEDLQLAAGTLKGILDINHIQVTPELRSLTLRGTPDQMIFAQKLLSDIDMPRSEVVVEVMVMEVSRDKMRTFGAVLPTTVSAAIVPGSSSSSSGSGTSLPISAFPGLGAGDIVVSLSSASFTALASDSGTKVIQRPEIRVMDSEKASLRIGDRIPIATGTFQSGLQAGVSTQFQYVDVGVNIDITPYVHADGEVTLKMALEISSVTGEQTIGGITEPTIGQRRIEHETRLADGEINLIGGILQDTESKSMSGYPLLTKIPILKYLFGQEAKERQQSEIVFAVTPHIVRFNPVTAENIKMLDLGSPTSVTYRSQGAESDTNRRQDSESKASAEPEQQGAPDSLKKGAALSIPNHQ